MKTRYKVLLGLLILATLGSCNSNDSGSKPEERQPGQNKTEEKELFKVSENQFKSSGMALAKIKTDTFNYQVSAQGYLDVPPFNKAAISSFMPGKVENLSLLIGDKVKKGDILLMINNPDFLILQQNYLKANEDLKYLKKEYERQKLLAADSISSQKKLQKSKNTYLNILANFQTLKQQLKLLNFDLKKIEEGDFSSLAPIYAPINGYITDLNVKSGSHINPSDMIMEIIDNSHIHMELKVFEKDILKIKPGQNINFMIPDMGTTVYSGYVHLVGKKIDPESRTVLVHGHLTGHHPDFITGMYVEAKINTGNFTGLSVPATAIIKQEENFFVLKLVKHNNKEYFFSKIQVIPGLSKGETVQIKETPLLNIGDEILGAGAFFIL